MLMSTFLTVLNDEIETGMRLLGATSLDALGPHMVNTRELETLVTLDAPEPRDITSRL